jgi:hypothetical protein
MPAMLTGLTIFSIPGCDAAAEGDADTRAAIRYIREAWIIDAAGAEEFIPAERRDEFRARCPRVEHEFLVPARTFEWMAKHIEERDEDLAP